MASELPGRLPVMRTPFKIGLIAAVNVFFAAFLAAILAGILRQDSFNGHVLTPVEQMPQAFVVATLAGLLALLGSWLGLRRSNPRCLTYRLGLGISLIYVVATWLASSLTSGTPQTVVIPSHEFSMLLVQTLLIGAIWGIGAPCVIAMVLKRLKFFGTTGA